MKIQNKEANRIEVQKIWSNLKSLITFDAQPKIALIIILSTVKFSTGHSQIKSYFASLTVLSMSMFLQVLFIRADATL